MPDRQLSYTWHSFTPEWGNAVRERVGFPEEFLERVATEPRSKVTFDLEALGKAVKLTIVDDDSEPGRTVLQTASQG